MRRSAVVLAVRGKAITMKRMLYLPLLALAACGAGEGPNRPLAEDRDYATQLTAPAPDYAAIIANADMIEPYEAFRDPSAEPPADAKRIGEVWLARLQERDVVDGYGLSGKADDAPIGGFDIRVTADDFDAWVAENGWDVPPHLRWSFMAPLRAPRVSDAAQSSIRVWPASEQRTGLKLQAADYGRVFLRDGCFFVDHQGTEKLAWLHAETGLDVDEEGYYVLVNRISGQVSGRLGERMVWAAPNAITSGGPDLDKFRAACGDGPTHGVGNPDSTARMDTMYPPQRAPDSAPPPGLE
ncbi:hypothetical protein [Aurantiacibacter aquimixticola]|uniref:Uncharacterized protein n=1 Tax=Aurantiacibacter aquimixticola TaxID=1958945 RepID=A0A419RS99_9SPHN|nr:hypothetical protein [Aurantiacibacter aquimixticola]RJY08661.1 hypothetical protein D6201_04165 [Aurantiacibacter aquimixticola]